MSNDLADLLRRVVPDQGPPLVAQDVLALARQRAKARRAGRVALGTLVAVAVLSEGVFGLVEAGHRANTPVPATGGPSTPPSTATPTGGVVPATPPPNTLRWAYSGLDVPQEGRDTLDGRAYGAWARANGRVPSEVGAAGALWIGTLPGDQTVVVVQAWVLSGGPTHTISYAESPGSGGRIVSDLVLDAATAQFAVTIPGPTTTWHITLRQTGVQITRGT
jgi:hypothetical protein